MSSASYVSLSPKICHPNLPEILIQGRKGKGGRERRRWRRRSSYAHVFPGYYLIARYFILSRQRGKRKEKRKMQRKL